MKLVAAVIKPFKVDEIVAAMREFGITGVTVGEARGFGRQGGRTETFRGAEYHVDFVPKVRIDVACNDNGSRTGSLT